MMPSPFKEATPISQLKARGEDNVHEDDLGSDEEQVQTDILKDSSQRVINHGKAKTIQIQVDLAASEPFAAA